MAFIKLIREETRAAEEKQAKALGKTAKSTVDTNREINKDLRIQRRKRSDSHRRQQTRRTSARTKEVNGRLTQLRKATLQGSTRRRRLDANRTWKTEGTITLNEIVGAVISTGLGALGGAIEGGGKVLGGTVRGGGEVIKPVIKHGSSTTGTAIRAPLNVATGKTSDARALRQARLKKLKAKPPVEAAPAEGGAQ